MERIRREIVKGEEENLKWTGERYEKWAEDFFFFLLVSFWNFKICLVYTKMEISTEKKSGNVTLPLWKIFLLRHCI